MIWGEVLAGDIYLLEDKKRMSGSGRKEIIAR